MIGTSLQTHNKEKIIPALKEKLSIKNIHAVPQLEKVVINVGLGRAIQDPKVIQVAVEELGKITGQKPVITRAKKAIANFKLRQGMPIGCMVTLRGSQMYEFIERLVHVSLPRVRDFKGISPKGFDKNGNYNLGIKEHLIFPEIDFDKVDKVFGMNITFVTSTDDSVKAKALLTEMGLPFRK
ncbi:MAG: 50S ribosomal protein L5 [Deltaproteobacteria bacterium]|nr:50S ribosomal protein L5 [Deltaproteobacteria bacterium]